uniref:Protein grindelwald n=1 Tax=Anopheles culicifacies TaxID=139723 RepID=A0A182MTC3_9DIPT
MAAKLAILMLAVWWTIPPTFGCDQACDRYKYCDEHKNMCADCSVLCRKDAESCYHKCPALQKRVDSLAQEVSQHSTTLWVLGIVVVILVSFLLVIVGWKFHSTILSLFRWTPKNKPTAPVGFTHENPNTKSPKMMPKNGANGAAKPTSTAVSMYEETEADNSVQTGTTSISHRYPAEDSTESYSYDNAACNVTPTSNKF